MDRTDKIKLCKVKFNLSACKHLTENEINSLSKTTRNIFYFIQAFWIKLKLRGFVNIWMLEDRFEDLDSATCGIFQIYFYENLLNPEENSKIQGNVYPHTYLADKLQLSSSTRCCQFFMLVLIGKSKRNLPL